MMPIGSRRSGSCVRLSLVTFAIVSALCVSAPALYWKLKEAARLRQNPNSCPSCHCDCPTPFSLLKMAPGLMNLSVEDCGKNDPELHEEMKKQFVDLLTEELKLQETVLEEHLERMNTTHRVAIRVASQYQREAEKCNTATETCEEARERAQALLMREKKETIQWEQRARQLGWDGQ